MLKVAKVKNNSKFRHLATKEGKRYWWESSLLWRLLLFCSTLNKVMCSFKPLNVTERGFLQPAAIIQVPSLDAGKSLTGKWITAIYRRTTKNREEGTEKGFAESRSMTERSEGCGAWREERKVRKILLGISAVSSAGLGPARALKNRHIRGSMYARMNGIIFIQK